jgi:anti-anti-sigma factor
MFAGVLPFGVRVTCAEGACRLRLEGELDLATCPGLERALVQVERQSPELLVLDLRGLTFMDVNGVRLLLSTQQRASDHGYELSIVRGPRAVQRPLELVGVETILNLIEHPVAALAPTQADAALTPPCPPRQVSRRLTTSSLARLTRAGCRIT